MKKKYPRGQTYKSCLTPLTEAEGEDFLRALDEDEKENPNFPRVCAKNDLKQRNKTRKKK